MPQAGQAPIPLHDPALIAGIAAYRRHPYQREVPLPPVLWQEGASRLLDYGSADRAAPPVLFVPSLINRAYVLDLMADHSMLRFLAASGVRPLLLDWGWPGVLERRLTLTDLIAGRLDRAITAASQAAPGPLSLAGYCMGGLLALAATCLQPGRIARLALLATPWDFAAPGGEAHRRLAAGLPTLEPLLHAQGVLPAELLQAGFAALDGPRVAEKYRDFGTQDQNSARARRFVALEDWLNDGVPLPAQVAREVIAGWYGQNQPATGQWLVAGAPIRPQSLTLPVLIAAPLNDRLVPPQSAQALSGLLPQAAQLTPATGHVGMVAGAQAQALLWEKLAAWLSGQSLG